MALLEVISTVFWTIAGNWITVLLGLSLVFLWKFKNSRFYALYTRKFPPGPTFIPLIGWLPGFPNLTAQLWMDISKKHNSKIVSMRAFGNIIVVINDYEMTKEYFVRSANLSDRQDLLFTKIADPNYKGVVSTSGQEWKVHRRFTMRMMRDLGMGKILGEQNIQIESQKAIAAFKEAGKNGMPFDPLNITNMAVSNIINGIVFGKQFDYDDQHFADTLKALNEWFQEMTNPKNTLMYLPFGKLLMGGTFKRLTTLYEKVTAFVVENIEAHQKQYDGGEVKDLIDAYLQEMETTDDKEIFNSNQLRYLIMDLFLAGSETTYSTLRWYILYMAAYPDVQEKVYRELKDALGDRDPSMHDKVNTPFTEAVICEIQRFSPLIPTTLPHANNEQDVEIEGYLLPPTTPVMANILQVHRDPQHWKNPDEFDPSNFLDGEGNFVSSEKLIPFAIGRRSCAGEALAKMELYIFFASWVKEFEILPETDATKIEIKINLDGLNTPKPYKIRMIPRK